MLERPQIDTLYRHICDNLASAVLLLDQKLNISFVNPAGEALLGLSARQCYGQSIETLFPNAQNWIDSLYKVIETRQQLTERAIQLAQAGTLKKITVDCTAVPTSFPSADHCLLIELHQIDRLRRISKEESLVSQQNALKVLVRGMAHEIKNPLGGLRGAAQLLEAELPSEDLKEYTQVIIGEADRLQNLVDDLLGPNRLPKKELLNIHKILEHVRQLIQAEYSESICFIRDYDPSIPEILGDEGQLIQLVLNIVRNAAQALKGKGNIRLRSRTISNFTIGQKRYRLVARIDVIDNGPGIAKDMLETIFYPMVTGRADGTGLGLSIAQNLAAQHHGLIECFSEPGNTMFTIVLPIESTETT
ncbi:MAG: nitrogen regulation protein NR(II) [Gammaproteobacteria bacterium]|nr:nitrogen regulation protein NR(II) [Gammaproteobacteria bacterium]MDH5729869.1 nitrogen regulation protein NR(II) [Gammaproteobacteria bacterium]